MGSTYSLAQPSHRFELTGNDLDSSKLLLLIVIASMNY